MTLCKKIKLLAFTVMLAFSFQNAWSAAKPTAAAHAKVAEGGAGAAAMASTPAAGSGFCNDGCGSCKTPSKSCH